MANFQTHIVTGIVVSGLSSTVALAAALISPADALALTLAGTIGSILPDIDLESSKQSRYMFGSLGVFFAFVVLFKYSQFLSIAELWTLWIGIYVLFRYVIYKFFHGYTKHRGIFHSLLAAVFFSLIGVITFSNLLMSSDTVSWMGGGFVLIGVMSHLILDEIYSVDFANTRVKRSFGTAIKIFDYRHPINSLALLAVVVGIFNVTPSSQQFVELMSTKENWVYLQSRMLPKNGKWFNFELTKVTSSKDNCFNLDNEKIACDKQKNVRFSVLYVR